MAGINKIINGNLIKAGAKGSAFVKALGSAFSPESIAKQANTKQDMTKNAIGK